MPRNRLLGQIKRRIVNPDARFPGELELNFLGDEAIEHLARQRLFVRQGLTLLGELLLHSL